MWGGREFYIFGAEIQKARETNETLCCGTAIEWQMSIWTLWSCDTVRCRWGMVDDRCVPYWMQWEPSGRKCCLVPFLDLIQFWCSANLGFLGLLSMAMPMPPTFASWWLLETLEAVGDVWVNSMTNKLLISSRYLIILTLTLPRS